MLNNSLHAIEYCHQSGFLMVYHDSSVSNLTHNYIHSWLTTSYTEGTYVHVPESGFQA